MISGILSCILRGSSDGSLVSTVNTGNLSSIRYNPHSQVTVEPFGWIIYLSPVFTLPSGLDYILVTGLYLAIRTLEMFPLKIVGCRNYAAV